MLILFLITTLLLLLQIALAMIGWSTRRIVKPRYSKPISSSLTPEKILNQNEKRFSQINLKVVNFLDDIAYPEEHLLLLNKKELNKNSLYNNYKFFVYFYLAFKEHRHLRHYKIAQRSLFVLQIFFLILAVVFLETIFNTFLIVSVMLQIFLILYTFYNYIIFNNFLKETYRRCKKILNLDNVEEARLEGLINDTNLEVYEYPFEIVWRIVSFFKP